MKSVGKKGQQKEDAGKGAGGKGAAGGRVREIPDPGKSLRPP